jgi:hypothetical protein
LFRVEVEGVYQALEEVQVASEVLFKGRYEGFVVGSFTTSPALGAVAAQYTSYIGDHPGSLAIATQSMLESVNFLQESMTRLVEAVEAQEAGAAESFFNDPIAGTKARQLEQGTLILPTRKDVPILDLAYTPPIAAIESGTEIKALLAMFTGDDSSILMASDAWIRGGKKLATAAKTLQSASATLAANTEGEAFVTMQSAISDVVSQGTIIAANATAMGTSMLELPQIRATAHATLTAMVAEAETRKTAATIAAAATPGGAAAAALTMATVDAETQAEVAAFVSSYLQPALDIARPTVSNLGVEVIGHTGGGALTTGTVATQAMGEVATQVSGGAQAAGQTMATQQVTQIAQQTGQVANTTSAAAPAAPMGRSTTAPAGGAAPGGGAPMGTAMQRTAATAPAGGVQTTGGGTSAASPATGMNRSTGSPAMAGTGTRTGTGTVAQPLLPRSLPMGGTGGTGSTGGTTGPGGPGGTGATGGPGTAGRIGAPGTGVPGAATGGAPAGGATRGGAVGMNGMGVGPGMAGTGAGAGSGGRQHAASSTPFTTGDGKKKSRRDLIKDYFRRQFMGEEPQTVRTVIR